MAAFVLGTFRIPSSRRGQDTQGSLRRRFRPGVRHLALKTVLGGGGGGQASLRNRYWNDGGGHWPPLSPSAAVVLTCTHRRKELLVARLENGRTGRGDTWLSRMRVTHIILLINLAVFAIQFSTAGKLLAAGAKVNSAIAAGQWYRLVSPIFLHASISHLAVNSYSLYATGPNVESWFGKKRFLALYASSGIAGNVLSFLCSPAPAVGASGAIFGLVGAMTVLLVRHRSILQRSRSALHSIGFIVIVNFAIGLTPGSQIDNFGHLGGLLGGLFFSYIAGPRLTRRRTVGGRYVLIDRPLYVDIADEFRHRMHWLLGGLK